MSSSSSETARDQLATLEAKINAILPPRYVGCFEDVSPNSMGSAKLKYDREGEVSWGEIWTSFCHLAMAGGPPHRGRLLEGVSTEAALAQPEKQAAVVAEIKRGIYLAAALSTTEAAPPGWVGVRCEDEDVAAWLVRAIVAENVIARHAGSVLYVPAGPDFRLDKEIKNVIVSVAKTCHYLLDHVDPDARPRGLGANLVQPPLPDELAAEPVEQRRVAELLRDSLSQRTGLPAVISETDSWIGLECPTQEIAIWMQRVVVVEDVLARREEKTLFVPIPFFGQNAVALEKVEVVVSQAQHAWRLHASEGV